LLAEAGTNYALWIGGARVTRLGSESNTTVIDASDRSIAETVNDKPMKRAAQSAQYLLDNSPSLHATSN